MPALASLEDLQDVQRKLEELKGKFPEAYDQFAAILRAYRRVGYKNICKLLLGEATPEKLKGEQ